jgi:hypothetical protein
MCKKQVPLYKFVVDYLIWNLKYVSFENVIKLKAVDDVNKQWESHVQAQYVLCYNKEKTLDKSPMLVKDILKEVKKKRLMHNAAWDIDESGIEASREVENANVIHESLSEFGRPDLQ